MQVWCVCVGHGHCAVSRSRGEREMKFCRFIVTRLFVTDSSSSSSYCVDILLVVAVVVQAEPSELD